MLSKLIPGGAGADLHTFVYRAIGSGSLAVEGGRRSGDPAVSVRQLPPTEAEINQLQAQIAQLKQALEQQVASAREAALREGEARGRAQAEAALRPVVDRMNASILEVLAHKPRLRKQVEEEAVRLSVAIARRILRRELSVDATALQGLVQVALERAGRQERHRIIVHPDQVAPVRAALVQLAGQAIEVVPDASRPLGTVILETARGSVDASIDTQLQEIELGLADRLKWRA